MGPSSPKTKTSPTTEGSLPVSYGRRVFGLGRPSLIGDPMSRASDSKGTKQKDDRSVFREERSCEALTDGSWKASLIFLVSVLLNGFLSLQFFYTELFLNDPSLGPV